MPVGEGQAGPLSRTEHAGFTCLVGVEGCSRSRGELVSSPKARRIGSFWKQPPSVSS